MNPAVHARESCVDALREKRRGRHAVHKQLLGGEFHFESDSVAMLQLVEAAYGGLPSHRLPVAPSTFLIELRLLPGRVPAPIGEPPAVQMHSGVGCLGGVMDASNYVVLFPEQRKALVVASEDMLERPYYVRYELIEFAVFTLATRGLGLVPLHGACVGRGGRGVLLLGASGSGKSTLALQALLRGLDFLSEDAVFVEPQGMLATGVANFLHVTDDALPWVADAAARQWLAQAPLIRRRSGVCKHEADLRLGFGALAAEPMALAGAIFVSRERAPGAAAQLKALTPADAARQLMDDQPYAVGQPGWQGFLDQLLPLGVHALRRGRTPEASVDALLTLLA
ncbi:serine kinase [Dyella solisilvae]|uniref:Serine kinase n=1 Tax=Dyella solisilvae TaxID=1920168 RepID=A0A370K5T5_9GAMM|nr:serine kinase [Dyella solisilvae]RDI98012.1 serine kinase [Dyella solisilvae]